MTYLDWPRSHPAPNGLTKTPRKVECYLSTLKLLGGGYAALTGAKGDYVKEKFVFDSMNKWLWSHMNESEQAGAEDYIKEFARKAGVE